MTTARSSHPVPAMPAALHHRASTSRKAALSHRALRKLAYASWPMLTGLGGIVVTIPKLKITGPNERLHWRAKSRQTEAEHRAVYAAFEHGVRARVATPVRVTIVRIGTRPLDTDNLAGSAKAVRDAVADWLGCGDSERDPIEWECRQERGDYAVRIEVRRST